MGGSSGKKLNKVSVESKPITGDVTFHYFQVNYRGALIRALLDYGKIKFTDKHYTMEEFPAVKVKFDYEQMPAIEINGKSMNQSAAISLYIARSLGIMGCTMEQEYLIQAFLGSYQDFMGVMRPVFFPMSDDEKNKLEQSSSALLDTITKASVVYEKYCKKLGGKYITGDSFTLADAIAGVLVRNLIMQPNRNEAYKQIFEKNAPTYLKYANQAINNELKNHFENGTFVKESPV